MALIQLLADSLLSEKVRTSKEVVLARDISASFWTELQKRLCSVPRLERGLDAISIRQSQRIELSLERLRPKRWVPVVRHDLSVLISEDSTSSRMPADEFRPERPPGSGAFTQLLPKMAQ
jgi:hypothetical protein